MGDGIQQRANEGADACVHELAASESPATGGCGNDLARRPRNIERQLARLDDPDTRVRALATCAVCRIGERAQSQIDRMDYFRRLLQAACGATLAATREPQSLRTERLRVGVDFPELDTVPHWTDVADDGRISIPFLEFIVTGVDAELGCFARHPDLTSADLKKIRGARRALGEILYEANPDDEPTDGLPRLHEVFVDPNKIVPVCREHGLLDQAIAACRNCCERTSMS